MKIRLRTIKKVSILDIEGKIDINSAEIIGVVSELLKYGNLDIILNLANVEYIDYNGLSILAITYKDVINHKGRIKFCNIPVHVLGLLEAAHLDNAFEIYANEKAAINSFKESISQIEKKVLRRQFKRLDMHVDVKYSLLTRPKELYGGKFLNISGAGIYIHSKDTFPVKTQLNLQIKLPDFSEHVKISGLVVWNADREIQPHDYPGMGIQFIDISPGLQRKILDFIDKNVSHRTESRE